MATITDLEDKYFDPALGLTRYYGDVEVIPHVDGFDYYNTIADALDACAGPGDKVYITGWVFDGDFDLRAPNRWVSPSKRFGSVLIDKAALGADVRLIFGCPYYSTGLCGSAVDGDMIFNGFIAAVDDDTLIGQAGIRNTVEQNIAEARLLREGTGGRPGTPPLQGRVLLDWGGKWPDSRHDKSVVIYNNSTKRLTAFVAGMDIAQERISTPEHLYHDPTHSDDYSWHDVALELQGSAALGVLDNFITRWVETATLPPRTHLCNRRIENFNPVIEPTPPTRPTGAIHPSTPSGASVRVMRSYEDMRAVLWGLKGGLIPVPVQTTAIPWLTLPSAPILEILGVLKRAIDRAERYIYIECQTLNAPDDFTRLYYTHDDLFPAISAACTRDVKVMLVCHDWILRAHTPGMSQEIRDRILAPLTPAQRANFGLFWVDGCRLHSKVMIVDDEFATIGSANMWDRSMRGWETEINAAYVHPGESNSLAADLRVRLWLEHLRISPGNVVAAGEVRDLSSGLGIFRSSWATSTLSISYPDSKLREISP